MILRCKRPSWSILLVISLTLMTVQPAGFAAAQGGETPTAAPTEEEPAPAPTEPPTPAGLQIPSATPTEPALLIPSNTPAPTEPAFAALSDDELMAINLQPADVPADFAAHQLVETFTAESMIGGLTEAGATDLAKMLEQIVAAYGWEKSVGITYSSCQPNIPIGEIYSDAGQFGTPALGRAFFEDPQVQAFFTGLGYDLSPSESLHGWRSTRTLEEPACFAQETEYWVFFEYWGLLITVSMTADSNTDPQMVWNLVDQLTAVVVAHADGAASVPFPPTPTPGAVAPTAVSLLPTAPAPSPTSALALPRTPAPVTPTAAVVQANLQDVSDAMPSTQDLQLQSPPWSQDNASSGMFLREQVVAQAQSGGMYQLAGAISNVGQQAGFIGQVVRLWTTGLDCSMVIQDLQITVALFESERGPVVYMNDPTMQTAWVQTGLFSAIEAHQVSGVAGQLWSGATNFDPCRPVVYRAVIVPHGRFLITIFVIAGANNDTSTVVATVDSVAEYVIEVLDWAHLQ